LYPEPALLIATYDSNGKPNVMTAAWAGICVSDPVSLMVAVQPPRHTHDAMLDRKAFTVCVPSEKLVAETDYAGMVLPIIFDCGSKNYYGIGKKLGKGWNVGKSLLNKK